MNHGVFIGCFLLFVLGRHGGQKLLLVTHTRFLEIVNYHSNLCELTFIYNLKKEKTDASL